MWVCNWFNKKKEKQKVLGATVISAPKTSYVWSRKIELLKRHTYGVESYSVGK